MRSNYHDDVYLAGSWQDADVLHRLLLSWHTALSRRDTDAFEEKPD